MTLSAKSWFTESVLFWVFGSVIAGSSPHLKPKKVHAGFAKSIASDSAFKHLRQVTKIKAHQAVAPGMTADEVADVEANQVADAQAKRGALLHPSQPGHRVADLQWSERVLKCLWKVAAEVLPLFPATDGLQRSSHEAAEKHTQ